MNKLYRIWSAEHLAWWRPNAAGYTTQFEDAGIYSEEDALKHTKNVGPEKQLALQMVDVPVPVEPYHKDAKTKEIQRLRDLCWKAGICPECEEYINHDITEPFASCKCHGTIEAPTIPTIAQLSYRCAKAYKLLDKHQRHFDHVEAWMVPAMGNGEPFVFVGCDIFRRKDPNEYCLWCERQILIKELGKPLL